MLQILWICLFITRVFYLNLKVLYSYERKNNRAMVNELILSFLVSHNFVDFSHSWNLWEDDNAFPPTEYSADVTCSLIS